MAGIFHKIRTTLEMIKWEHSIFALPFALTAVLLAANGLPAWRTVGVGAGGHGFSAIVRDGVQSLGRCRS